LQRDDCDLDTIVKCVEEWKTWAHEYSLRPAASRDKLRTTTQERFDAWGRNETDASTTYLAAYLQKLKRVKNPKKRDEYVLKDSSGLSSAVMLQRVTVLKDGRECFK